MKRIPRVLAATSLVILVTTPATAVPTPDNPEAKTPNIISSLARMTGGLLALLWPEKLGAEIDPNGVSGQTVDRQTGGATSSGASDSLGAGIDPSGVAADSTSSLSVEIDSSG